MTIRNPASTHFCLYFLNSNDVVSCFCHETVKTNFILLSSSKLFPSFYPFTYSLFIEQYVHIFSCWGMFEYSFNTTSMYIMYILNVNVLILSFLLFIHYQSITEIIMVILILVERVSTKHLRYFYSSHKENVQILTYNYYYFTHSDFFFGGGVLQQFLLVVFH